MLTCSAAVNMTLVPILVGYLEHTHIGGIFQDNTCVIILQRDFSLKNYVKLDVAVYDLSNLQCVGFKAVSHR